MDEVADLERLYQAANAAAKGVAWKASTQRYMLNVMSNVVRARNDLLEGNDIKRGFTYFDIYERGKLRHISSVKFSERVCQKSLSVNALVPAITPTLVAGCSANIRGRGTEYAIRRLKSELAEHYRRHGKDGYVLLIDFKDYFAQIDHGAAREFVHGALDDPRVLALFDDLLDAQGERGLGLGSEPNQIVAVSLPSRIDHHVLETCGVEAYGRYMDDSYAIHTDKAHLWGVLSEIEWLCGELGIGLNREKTRIVRLSRGFTFLKKKFSYGKNGRVVVRPCRDSITRERRKLKKHAAMVERGDMTLEQAEQSYQSWRGHMARLDAHRTVRSMDVLYRELFEKAEENNDDREHGQAQRTGG